jgi:hypothetical protein
MKKRDEVVLQAKECASFVSGYGPDDRAIVVLSPAEAKGLFL